MSGIKDLYKSSLALLTDLYELTMAYGYWKAGLTGKEAAFTLFYRTNPFNGGFCVACGLDAVVQYLSAFRFDKSDIDYLAGLETGSGKQLFDSGFLDFLAGMNLECDVDGVPEGTAVFPFEPLLRVTGPLIQCQILETALLNMINFQTLIATKAARVRLAAEGDSVLEFGLRRAQGFDGGISASRASYIGGCTGTSNVLAGKLFGIPVKGTHAHSWVMAFDSEEEAFRVYADSMPENCIFLVDTYDTIEGIRHAVAEGVRLRKQGYRMIGIRLDSGDLEALSKSARDMLDEAGLDDAVIVGSSDLDEYKIASLKKNGAPITVWGVGTRLATGHEDPALGGVYKLVAVRDPGKDWNYRIKVSDDAMKTTIPGILQVRRYSGAKGFIGDVIYDTTIGIQQGGEVADPLSGGISKSIPADADSADLLVPVMRGGDIVYTSPSIHDSRDRAHEQIKRLKPSVTSLNSPECYPVSIEKNLYDMKTRLVGRHTNNG